MSVRYAPIPNPHSDPDTNPELDAAFDDSDDDDNDDLDESRPLNPHRPTSPRLSADHSTRFVPTYDFDTPVTDWDRPPPGSPPPATPLALPNSIGNSNGIIPTSTPDMSTHTHTSWWRRTTALLSQSSHSTSSHKARVMGGGTGNDGVFSNVSAKPTTSGTRVQQGDSIYVVPEEASSAAPPSYAAAQADAAPPYHTSLVLLPPSTLFDTNALSGPQTRGSVIVDALPTGTLITFLWNTLVSTTFQFVGFVLTWVMHTTHAAKYGSRAGLGITLIQLGLTLRARLDDVMNAGTDTWEDGARVTFGSTTEAEDYYNSLLGNSTTPATAIQPIPAQGESQWNSLLTGPTATEWLSFFLMFIGWSLLLTSSLWFWRVKRWEQSILASYTSNSSSVSRSHARTLSEITDEEESRHQSFFERIGLFRFPTPHQSSDLDGGVGARSNAVPVPTENSTGSGGHQQHGTAWFSDPERASRARDAFTREQRLCEDLRAAGLL